MTMVAGKFRQGSSRCKDSYWSFTGLSKKLSPSGDAHAFIDLRLVVRRISSATRVLANQSLVVPLLSV